MDTRQRQTAFKVRVSDLLNGKYFVQEGWEPNYILINGNKVSRINLIGVIVSKESSEASQNETMMIDDGSGRISARSFGEGDFSSVKVGDVVVLIGRPREYGSEMYIVPEIIKALQNKGWVDVRKVELEMNRQKGGATEESNIAFSPDKTNQNKAADEEINLDSEDIEEDDQAEKDNPKNVVLTPAEKIMECIKNMDNGDGADFEDIIKESGQENAEKLLEGLMKRGDVFELRPGKLKVLE